MLFPYFFFIDLSHTGFGNGVYKDDPVRDPVSVHDHHATMLQLPGIDHQGLTGKFQGLDFKLAGVEESRMVNEILAPAPSGSGCLRAADRRRSCFALKSDACEPDAGSLQPTRFSLLSSTVFPLPHRRNSTWPRAGAERQ